MKRTTLLLASLALAAGASAQTTIAYWAENDNGTGTQFGYQPSQFPLTADVGTGTLSLASFDTTTVVNGDGVTVYDFIESFAGTTTNALAGFDAGGSLSPQVGPDIGGGVFSNNGMQILINVSTVGFTDIVVSWAQRGTNSGFAGRQFAYSTNGTDFTDFGTDTGVLGSTFTTRSYDLSAIDAIEGLSSLTFRITLTGGTGATGNNRFDNILVQGVPESSSVAALLGAAALGLVSSRRRRA